MKKRRILIPEPKSKFIRVKCPECGNEQITFDHASFPARCIVCGRILVKPRGGKALILGEIIRVLG